MLKLRQRHRFALWEPMEEKPGPQSDHKYLQDARFHSQSCRQDFPELVLDRVQPRYEKVLSFWPASLQVTLAQAFGSLLGPSWVLNLVHLEAMPLRKRSNGHCGRLSLSYQSYVHTHTHIKTELSALHRGIESAAASSCLSGSAAKSTKFCRKAMPA